jgi:hypothetical protein
MKIIGAKIITCTQAQNREAPGLENWNIVAFEFSVTQLLLNFNKTINTCQKIHTNTKPYREITRSQINAHIIIFIYSSQEGKAIKNLSCFQVSYIRNAKFNLHKDFQKRNILYIRNSLGTNRNHLNENYSMEHKVI